MQRVESPSSQRDAMQSHAEEGGRVTQREREREREKMGWMQQEVCISPESFVI